MHRTDHTNHTPLGSAGRPRAHRWLAGLIAAMVAAGTLAVPAAALARPKGGATPVTCDGWAVGTVRSTKVTFYLPSGPVSKVTWEVCGADGHWGPTGAPAIAPVVSSPIVLAPVTAAR